MTIAPRIAQGLGKFSALAHLESERERDERGVRIPRTQIRLGQTLRSGRHAVHSLRVPRSGTGASSKCRAAFSA